MVELTNLPVTRTVYCSVPNQILSNIIPTRYLARFSLAMQKKCSLVAWLICLWSALKTWKKKKKFKKAQCTILSTIDCPTYSQTTFISTKCLATCLLLDWGISWGCPYLYLCQYIMQAFEQYYNYSNGLMKKVIS